MADDLLREPRRLSQSGYMFRMTVEDYFKKACDRISHRGLEIICPQHDEFLIGDTPAFTVDHKRGALGFRDGVSIDDATTIVLPLGPHRLVALGPKDEWVSVPQSFVEELNGFQVRKAVHQVFMRPGSGLQAFVKAQRPPCRLTKHTDLGDSSP
jgi:hypothetical protein